MQVFDPLAPGASMPAADRNPVVPSRTQDAFWQEVFDAATAVQAQAGSNALPGRSFGTQAAAIGAPPADPVVPSPDVPAAKELPVAPAEGCRRAAVPLRSPGLASVQSDARLAVATLTVPEPVARGRAGAPSARPSASAPEQASSQAASPWAQAEACASEMPWRATFVVDASGQRRLFLRASGLDDAQAIALAARLDQEQPERGRPLGSVHLNGRPIYQQEGGSTASTLLVC